MTIKKFLGKTEDEAKEKAKAELGPKAIIMSVRAVKPKGLAGVFKGVSFEVTAAIEDQDDTKTNKSLQVAQTRPEKINLAADEEIPLPKQEAHEMSASVQAKKVADTMEKIQPLLQNTNAHDAAPFKMPAPKPEMSALERYSKNNKSNEQNLDQRLEEVKNTLDEHLNEPDDLRPKVTRSQESLRVMKMVYKVLLDNEVDEKYANQILDEIDSVLRASSSMDVMLSNIYQKIILKFGQNEGINLEGKHPKIYFFVGPTGVGKTTTIAKVASKLKVESGKKVAFLTADTYRIAAAEQLRTYANILDAPLEIVYSPEELNDALEQMEEYDAVLVDTAGFSHKSKEQKDDVRRLIAKTNAKYEKNVFLVLSATTKYSDLLDIADAYAQICNFDLIFTKLDETNKYGNLLNVCLYTGAPISFITNGQNVPEDIERFNSQKIVKQLLGGRESWTRPKDSAI
ncbi:MAG: flagellar biosynthesis protein FlhF [Eubacterium sp.]|nr:flagellar biosynthesis protein FlhF [Eubacterium sp.]